MRRTLRALAIATALSAPLVAVGPAFASEIQVPGTNDCVTADTPTAQYNNGDPTTQPGHFAVSNCTKY